MRSSTIGILALASALLISTRSTSSTDLAGHLQPGSSSSTGELYNTIAQMDSVVFEAFNHRNLGKLRTMFSEDLEFYHDLGGVTRYAENMEAFGKTFAGERLVRRELVAVAWRCIRSRTMVRSRRASIVSTRPKKDSKRS